MNKGRIDKDLRAAYQALDKSGIVEDVEGRKVIDFSFRGQIASFGASISMGSLLSAIAFFSAQNSAEVARDKLMNAILFILKADGRAKEDCSSLYAYAAERTDGKEKDCREDILNAAIALKLAMNLYPRKNVEKKQDKGQEGRAT